MEGSGLTAHDGKLINGTELDNSYRRKEPATFPVNGVIRGWTEALQLMKEGSTWQIVGDRTLDDCHVLGLA
jgi:FKBP-type peptidyl-prolyl cis-trans isomerase FklB